jgi:hypothetical protein
MMDDGKLDEVRETAREEKPKYLRPSECRTLMREFWMDL